MIKRLFRFQYLIHSLLALSLAACASASANQYPIGTVTSPSPTAGTPSPAQASPSPAGTQAIGTSPSPAAGSPVVQTGLPFVLPTIPIDTPTPSPTLTPTPAPLIPPGTPLPQLLPLITAGNANQVGGLALFTERNVTDLAWTPDGDTLAVARLDGISLYDIRTRERLRSLYPNGEGVVSMAFSPDGRWLVTGNRFGSEQEGYGSNLQLWLGPYWQPLGILYGEMRGLTEVAFSPDGKTLAAALSRPEILRDSSVEIWNTTTWEISRTLQTGTALNVTFSRDGKVLASIPDRYAVRLWQLKDGTLMRTLYTSFTGAVNSIVFSPDGTILATGHYDGAIRLWNPGNGELIRTLQTNGVVDSLAFSPDGSLLASGESYQSHLVSLWATGTGQLLRTLEGHTHAVDNLIFSPDGQILVSASYDGTIRLWGVR